MTFEKLLDQAIAMPQRRGRLTYRALQRQFQLDDAPFEDLNDALLYAYPQVRDDAGRGLVWTDNTGTAAPGASAPAVPEPGASCPTIDHQTILPRYGRRVEICRPGQGEAIA